MYFSILEGIKKLKIRELKELDEKLGLIFQNNITSGNFSPLNILDIENALHHCKYHFGVNKPDDWDWLCGCSCVCKLCIQEFNIEYKYMLEEFPLAPVAHERDCPIENCNGCWQPTMKD